MLTLDMSKKENVLLISDFIFWASGYIYEDKDMARIVKLFCDNTGLEHSNLIFHVKSVILTGFQERCKKLIVNKSKEIKQKENNLNF